MLRSLDTCVLTIGLGRLSGIRLVLRGIIGFPRSTPILRQRHFFARRVRFTLPRLPRLAFGTNIQAAGDRKSVV